MTEPSKVHIDAMTKLVKDVEDALPDHEKVIDAINKNMDDLPDTDKTELKKISDKMIEEQSKAQETVDNAKIEVKKGPNGGGYSTSSFGKKGGYNYNYGGQRGGLQVGPSVKDLINFFEEKSKIYPNITSELENIKKKLPSDMPVIDIGPTGLVVPKQPNAVANLILTADDKNNINIEVDSVKIGDNPLDLTSKKADILELIKNNKDSTIKTFGGYKKTMKRRRNGRKHKKSKRVHNKKMGKI